MVLHRRQLEKLLPHRPGVQVLHRSQPGIILVQVAHSAFVWAPAFSSNLVWHARGMLQSLNRTLLISLATSEGDQVTATVQHGEVCLNQHLRIMDPRPACDQDSVMQPTRCIACLRQVGELTGREVAALRWPRGDGVPLVEDVVAFLQPYSDRIILDAKTHDVVRPTHQRGWLRSGFRWWRFGRRPGGDQGASPLAACIRPQGEAHDRQTSGWVK